MGLTKDLVNRALTTVDGPDGADLVTSGIVQWVAACDSFASIKLSLPGPPEHALMTRIADQAEQAIRRDAQRAGERVDAVRFRFVDHAGNQVFAAGAGPDEPDQAAQDHPTKADAPSQQAAQPAEQGQAPSAIPGVRCAIAVGAGKGGVGKSTIAVNLAVGLARKGHAVGLLDGDIYGPSLPTMLGLGPLEQAVVSGKLQPFTVHGLKAVTIGKLVDPERPLIWRGPMAHGAFQQLTSRTNWGELDYMIIDLPPGTGDVPLTLAQSVKLSGAVIVCTPQRVAQDDAVRATRMFQQLGVDILGVVENMSYFVGDDGKEYDIFGRGGAEQMAQRIGLPFLGGVPINMALRHNADHGEPLANFDPETAGGEQLPRALERLTQSLEGQANLAMMRMGSSTPTLNIS